MKIALLTTGGTIASQPTARGLAPAMDAQALLERASGVRDMAEIVVENVFAWPGVGRLCIASIFNRDYPVIQAYVLLVGVLFVFFNLFFDILQYVADPRLRERKA